MPILPLVIAGKVSNSGRVWDIECYQYKRRCNNISYRSGRILSKQEKPQDYASVELTAARAQVTAVRVSLFNEIVARGRMTYDHPMKLFGLCKPWYTLESQGKRA